MRDVSERTRILAGLKGEAGLLISGRSANLIRVHSCGFVSIRAPPSRVFHNRGLRMKPQLLLVAASLMMLAVCVAAAAA